MSSSRDDGNFSNFRRSNTLQCGYEHRTYTFIAELNDNDNLHVMSKSTEIFSPM